MPPPLLSSRHTVGGIRHLPDTPVSGMFYVDQSWGAENTLTNQTIVVVALMQQPSPTETFPSQMYNIIYVKLSKTKKNYEHICVAFGTLLIRSYYAEVVVQN